MNAFINLLKLAWLQLIRHKVRSLLTIFGVASGMFLFTAVETLQRSLAKATEATAADTTLVVYRQNRFCPSASRLPEHYADEIRRMDGVREVSMSAFDKSYIDSIKLEKLDDRTRNLINQIKESGELNPFIVAVDS